MNQRYQTGFTLAELMAVVVIIGIMAGIGLGSYKKAMERSRFAEGLSLAHNIMEARERYYLENVDKSDADRKTSDYGKLDIELTGGSSSGASFTGKNFVVTMVGDGVEAIRRGGNYTIKVFQDSRAFGATARSSDRCVGTNTDGKDYCISMGFGNCSGNSCAKI